MLACHGRAQREGKVTHVIADRLDDLSALLRGVGERDAAFPIRHGRGDGAMHPAARDPRDGTGPGAAGARRATSTRRSGGAGIKVLTQDFR